MNDEFWTDLTPELEHTARELPEDLDVDTKQELRSLAGLNAQEPYSPAVAYGMRQEQMTSGTDPQGSWTGIPDDLSETPVQDADDL